MADSSCFELACEALERETSFDRLAARGTVRLALKSAGLDPRDVTPEQMTVVVGSLLPGELESRGVKNAEQICADLEQKLAQMESASPSETPEAVFARLGGS